MPVADADEQRGRVAPEVDARLVAHLLEPAERHGVPSGSRDPEAVQHPSLVGVVSLDEQVEPAALDLQSPAQEVGLDPARRRPLVVRVRDELVHVVDRDRQLEHQPVPGPLAEVEAGLRVLHAQGREAPHAFGEAQTIRPVGHRARLIDDGGRCDLRPWPVVADHRRRSTGGGLQDVGAAAVGHGGDRQGRVGPDRAGEQRAVEHVQTRMAEDLTPGVADPLGRVPAHHRTTDRVHRDHPSRPPEGVVVVGPAQLGGDGPHRPVHAAEVLRRRFRRPVHGEPSARVEAQDPVRHVTTHAEQREGAAGQRAVTEHRREVGPQRRVATVQHVVDHPVESEGRCSRERAHPLRRLRQPGPECRVAGILDVVPAPVRTVLVDLVGDADRARDHRAEVGVQVAATALAGRTEHEPEEVAVSREATAQRSAETRQGRSVAQQEQRGAEGARGEDEPVAPHGVRGEVDGRLAVATGVDDVDDLVAAALERAEPPHLVAGPDVGTVVLRSRQVGVVEGVLRAVVAPQVALAAQPAGDPGQPVDVAVVGGLDLAQSDRRLALPPREADRQGRERQRHPGALGGLTHRSRLGSVEVGVGGGADHLLDGVVVRLEVGAGHRPVLVSPSWNRLLVHEPLLVLAQQHVGVDERTPTQAAGHESVEALEAPHVVQPVSSRSWLPEVLGHPARSAGEGPRRVGPPALEDDHRPSGLGQAIRRDRPPEP